MKAQNLKPRSEKSFFSMTPVTEVYRLYGGKWNFFNRLRNGVNRKMKNGIEIITVRENQKFYFKDGEIIRYEYFVIRRKKKILKKRIILSNGQFLSMKEFYPGTGEKTFHYLRYRGNIYERKYDSTIWKEGRTADERKSEEKVFMEDGKVFVRNFFFGKNEKISSIKKFSKNGELMYKKEFFNDGKIALIYDKSGKEENIKIKRNGQVVLVFDFEEELV